MRRFSSGMRATGLILLCAPFFCAAQEPAQEPEATIPVQEQANPAKSIDPPKESDEIPEVIVTATKRGKSLRDVPSSIGAFQGEDLENINAQSIKDYLRTVPGVQLVEKEQDRTVVTIRGIATDNSLDRNTAGTVGIFIDELPLNDAFRQLTQVDVNPFDLERVEVLKGPQGTLFGAGALAGAIRYITKKPEMGVWGAKLQSSYSDNEFGRPRQFVGAAVNIPVYTDQAALRIAVNYLDRGGLIDTSSSFELPDQGQPNEDQRFDSNGRREVDVDNLLQKTIRATGQWNFNEQLRFNLLGLYQESLTDDNVSVDNFDGDFSNRNAPAASPGKSTFSAFNFVPSYDFDWGTLTSSSGYITKEFFTDAPLRLQVGEETVTDPNDGEPGDDFGPEDESRLFLRRVPFGGDQTGVIQELRLASPDDPDSRWEWLTGAAYSKSKQYYSFFTATSPELTAALNGLPVSTCPAPVCPVPTPVGSLNGREYEIANQTYDSTGTEMALFGEFTYKFFDDRRLEVTVGGRLFRNRLEVLLEGRGLTTSVVLGRASFSENYDYAESGFNPKFSARYIFSPNIQTYVLAAKGFQFGGVQIAPPFNGTAFVVAEDAISSYKSSSLWLYEWGWRTDWFDRRLRIDAAAYYYDWTDLQLQRPTFLPNPLPKEPEFPDDVPVFGNGVRDEQTRRREFSSFISNLGRAVSEGLEVALTVNPIRGLSFSSSANFLRARLTEDYVGGDGSKIPAGRPLAGAPRFQITNSLSYSTPFRFFGAWESGASVTHTHTTSANSDILFADPGTEEFDTLNAGVFLSKPDWRLTPGLRFNISNLTDVRAIQARSGSDRGRNLAVHYVQPRTAILALDLKW